LGIIVTTRQGKLEGDRHRGVERFKGIPFARPPIGPLRFQAPQPPQAWNGIRDATAFGPAAPQIGPVHRLIRGMIGVAGSRGLRLDRSLLRLSSGGAW
jgi:carboxylesterase type B